MNHGKNGHPAPAKNGEEMSEWGTDVPADFDPHDWPFFWASQMVGVYIQRLERSLKRNGLDVARYRVLMCVGDKDMNISEIAELAIVKLPTMMKIIQRMEAEGLVSSRPRATDGRFTDVSLTKQGKQMRKIAWESANQLYKSSFAGIDAQEEAQLNATMKRIFDQLNG